jgi:membrane fusion protein (multidrug efflux system)
VWIDANFKEGQLERMRTGQPVIVHTDLYGSDVTYHGHVVGIAAGSGNAFALLPSQNASGNWIKIVQRLPVRIGLDPHELEAHPLFLGLSTKVDVDIRVQSGATLSQQPAWVAALNTDVYATQEAGADAAISAILAANLPHADTQRTAAAPQVAQHMARGRP